MSVDASWEITFTQQFARDAKSLQKAGYTNWLQKLTFLKDGPKTSSNQLKALKNYSKAFRWRAGDLRVIFRVVGATKNILLLAAGHRKSVYKKKLGPTQKVIGALDQILIKAEERGSPRKTLRRKVPPPGFLTFELIGEEASLEELLVDDADLFLLDIPEAFHEILLDAKSLNDAALKSLPFTIRERLEDYLTAPGQHHVGRAYSLASTDSFSSIAEQSLDKFLVALDPQQKNIVDRSFSGGPWLVRGGPGTGKTLINLARIQRIFEEGVGVDLLNTHPVRVGFVTFNKPLSRSAKAMFDAISREGRGQSVDFVTLDSIVFKLLNKLGSAGNDILSKRVQEVLLDRVLKDFDNVDYDQRYIEDVLERRSSSFFLEEFAETILGCDLHIESDYLSYPRRGRKTALQAKERGFIHALYRNWLEGMKALGATTFEARRLSLLKRINAGRLDVTDFEYDFLFVDELQDLSIVAIRILTHLVRHPENLSFSADTAQSIYLKSPSWSAVSPKIRFHAGNSFILRKSYRMTRQIDEAVRPLRLNSGDDEKENGGIDQPIFTGEKPCWLDCNVDDHAEIAASLVRSLSSDHGVNLGQIAIVSPDKKMTEAVRAQIATLDLSVDMVANKSVVDIQSEAVHLLHTHIAKGLEFPFVIVPGVVDGKYPNSIALQSCGDEDARQEELDRSRRLLYVALSRAARGLWMLTDSRIPSPLLSSLNPFDWDVSKGELGSS